MLIFIAFYRSYAIRIFPFVFKANFSYAHFMIVLKYNMQK